MKELKFEFEKHTLAVNGKEYNILMSEKDIVDKSNRLRKEAIEDQKLEAGSVEEADAVTELYNKSEALVDGILGAGAWVEITGGAAMGYRKSMGIAVQIAASARTLFEEEKLDTEFGLDED